jgi:hypothetical protein
VGENHFTPACRKVNTHPSSYNPVHSTRTVVRMEEKVSRRIEGQSSNLQDRKPHILWLLRKPTVPNDAAHGVVALDFVRIRQPRYAHRSRPILICVGAESYRRLQDYTNADNVPWNYEVIFL